MIQGSNWLAAMASLKLHLWTMAKEKRFDEDSSNPPRSYRDARRDPLAEPIRGSLKMPAKAPDEPPGEPGSGKLTELRGQTPPPPKLEETREERFLNRLKYVILALLVLGVLTACGILAYRAFTGEKSGEMEFSAQLQEYLSPEKFGQAYVEANGGAGFLRSLRSIRATGTMEGPETSHEVFLLKRAPDKTLFRLTNDGTTITYGTNGEEYWRSITRDNRIVEIILLEGKERASLERSSAFFGVLLGHFLDPTGSIQEIGIAEWDGQSVIRIDWVDAERDEEVRFFVDPESMNLLRSVRLLSDGGTAETLYEDYRSLDSFRQPFRIENRANGELVSVLTIDSAEINAGIVAVSFSRPATTAPGRNPGSWNMEEEVRFRLSGEKTDSP